MNDLFILFKLRRSRGRSISWLWCSLAILALLAAGCAAIETPAPALTPTPTQAPATVTPTNTPAASPTPPPSPTATTPAPSPTVIGRRGTPQPLAFSRQGDTLPTRPVTSPTTPRHQFATSIPCTVSTAGLTLREGPGPGYRLISNLSPAATVTAYKCVPGASWLLVETAQGQIGWVQTALLNCQGDVTDLPVAQGVFAQPGPSPDAGTQATSSPTATPSPAPAVDAWRGEYFDNSDLAGQPVLVRNDPTLEFDWALDSPDPNLPQDDFSVRWTRVFNLETSDYRFLARADDGIKVYLDGWLVIDQWRETVPRTHIGEFGDVQAGPHTITVEYFEAGGLAHIQFWFEKTVLIENAWTGEYFNNRDWQGEPVLVRADEDIDFDWDDDAPVEGVDDDRFSVRWRRSIHFDAGDYRFSAEVGDEDMVRILLDGWLIVDRYREDSGEISGRFDQLGEGYHTVVVEFQERGDEAKIEVDWEIDD